MERLTSYPVHHLNYPKSLFSAGDHTIACVHEAGHVIAARCHGLPLHQEHAVRRTPADAARGLSLTTNTLHMPADWVPQRLFAGLHFFLAGAAAADALLLRADVFPGVDRPKFDAAVDEDWNGFRVAWNRGGDGPLHTALGYPSEEALEESLQKDLRRDLEDWAEAHTSQIQTMAEHIFQEFGHDLDAPEIGSGSGHAISAANIDGVLGAPGCTLESCYAKGSVAGP